MEIAQSGPSSTQNLLRLITYVTRSPVFVKLEHTVLVITLIYYIKQIRRRGLKAVINDFVNSILNSSIGKLANSTIESTMKEDAEKTVNEMFSSLRPEGICLLSSNLT
jgi:hypothetical protein